MERKIRELGPKDTAWIEANIAQGIELCKLYAARDHQPPTLADLDRAFHAWKAAKQTNKSAETEVINGLGCLFGQLMVAEFGLKWNIVSDDFGTSLALLHPNSSWETYPLDFVAKRVYSENDEGSFFQAMHNLMRDELYRHK